MSRFAASGHDEITAVVVGIADRARSEWAVPRRLASEARDITVRRFADHGADAPRRAALESYFWGVVRRRALKGGPGLGDLRARFIEASRAS
jgi:hypothetical protein